MTDESALKDIVDALGERIFSLEGLMMMMTMTMMLMLMMKMMMMMVYRYQHSGSRVWSPDGSGWILLTFSQSK